MWLLVNIEATGRSRSGPHMMCRNLITENGFVQLNWKTQYKQGPLKTELGEPPPSPTPTRQATIIYIEGRLPTNLCHLWFVNDPVATLSSTTRSFSASMRKKTHPYLAIYRMLSHFEVALLAYNWNNRQQRRGGPKQKGDDWCKLVGKKMTGTIQTFLSGGRPPSLESVRSIASPRSDITTTYNSHHQQSISHHTENKQYTIRTKNQVGLTCYHAKPIKAQFHLPQSFYKFIS